MKGWVKFHREILDSDLWNDVTTFRLFTYLLLKVSHQDGVKINGLEVNHGQWIRSYRKLAQDLAYKEGRGLKEYSLKTISKCVNKLVKSGSVSIQETEQGTLFTIVNYAIYQDFSEDEERTGNGIGKEEETNGKRTVNKNKNANNAKNAQQEEDIKPSCRKSKTFDEESIPFQLSLRLFENIRKNNTEFKEPNLQKWSDDFRLMMERDKRTEEQITYLIDWCQQDSFWKGNILSPSKLRKQYDQLVIKIKAEKQKKRKSVHDIPLERPSSWEEPPELTEEEYRQMKKWEEELPY